MDPRIVRLEGEHAASGEPCHGHADRDDDQAEGHEACLRAEILEVEREPDRLLDHEHGDRGRADAGGQREEATHPLVVRPQAEDAPACPEAGHQADHAGDRREERDRRAGAAGDRQDRPDQVGKQAGQGAGPRPGKHADEHGPDRVEVDRHAQCDRDRADGDVDRDRHGHERQRGRLKVTRAAADDGDEDHADDDRDQVDDLDRGDAALGLPFATDLQPAQAVHRFPPRGIGCWGLPNAGPESSRASVPRSPGSPPAHRRARRTGRGTRRIALDRDVDVRRPAPHPAPVGDGLAGRQGAGQLDVDGQRLGPDEAPVEGRGDRQRVMHEGAVEAVVAAVELHVEAQRVGEEAHDRVRGRPNRRARRPTRPARSRHAGRAPSGGPG